MRIRRIGALVVACAGLLLSSLAGADDDLARRGYYINLGGAYAVDRIDATTLGVLLAVPPVAMGDDASWGLNVRAGYRRTSWLALEIQYEWMDGFSIRQLGPSAFGPANAIIATYRPDVTTVNAKFHLPIWRTDPYLVVGGGFVSYDVDFTQPLVTLGRSDNAFAFRGGAGLDFYLTKQLVLNVEGSYVLNTDSTTIPLSPAGQTSTIDDLYYISLGAGLTIRF